MLKYEISYYVGAYDIHATEIWVEDTQGLASWLYNHGYKILEVKNVKD